MPHRRDAQILVVDDDPLTRQFLTQTIAASGFDCVQASGATEAWRLVHEREPTVLLLDYDMPEMNGADLLKRLRADRDPAIAQIPTIMLTGHTGEESEVRCLEAGADDFVTKPVNVPILRARIDTQLRLRHMRRQLEEQKRELQDWRGNLERDLEAARLTQQSLIPQKPLKLAGWEVATCFRPVIQVGGDIYGWVRMNDGRVLFWIADATGHGASAALLTTLTKLLFHHGNTAQASPAAIMTAVNRDFRSIFGARLFMTAMCAALDPTTGKLTVLGAGHPPLLISRAHGERELIWSSAPPLGLAKDEQFAERIVDLGPGDRFVLYTDGMFGGTGSHESRLSPAGLAQKLNGAELSADATLQRMLASAVPTAPGVDASDDIAAVAVRRLP